MRNELNVLVYYLTSVGCRWWFYLLFSNMERDGNIPEISNGSFWRSALRILFCDVVESGGDTMTNQPKKLKEKMNQMEREGIEEDEWDELKKMVIDLEKQNQELKSSLAECQKERAKEQKEIKLNNTTICLLKEASVKRYEENQSLLDQLAKSKKKIKELEENQ